MRTCLGILLMVPALIGLAITGIYHVSVNSQLRFEKVDTQDAYINKQRSIEKAGRASPLCPAPACSFDLFSQLQLIRRSFRLLRRCCLLMPAR